MLKNFYASAFSELCIDILIIINWTSNDVEVFNYIYIAVKTNRQDEKLSIVTICDGINMKNILYIGKVIDITKKSLTNN